MINFFVLSIFGILLANSYAIQVKECKLALIEGKPVMKCKANCENVGQFSLASGCCQCEDYDAVTCHFEKCKWNSSPVWKSSENIIVIKDATCVPRLHSEAGAIQCLTRCNIGSHFTFGGYCCHCARWNVAYCMKGKCASHKFQSRNYNTTIHESQVVTSTQNPSAPKVKNENETTIKSIDTVAEEVLEDFDDENEILNETRRKKTRPIKLTKTLAPKIEVDQITDLLKSPLQ